MSEGINFALMDGLKLLEKQSGHKFLEIYVGGGGTRAMKSPDYGGHVPDTVIPHKDL